MQRIDSERSNERARRAAVNQALARDANETTEELRPSSTYVEFVCECWRRTCEEPIALSLDEYEEVRRVPTRFIVARGHVLPSIEVVVEETPRYQVVQKRGLAGDVAIRLDSRQRHKAIAQAFEEPSPDSDLGESAAV